MTIVPEIYHKIGPIQYNKGLAKVAKKTLNFFKILYTFQKCENVIPFKYIRKNYILQVSDPFVRRSKFVLEDAPIQKYELDSRRKL